MQYKLSYATFLSKATIGSKSLALLAKVLEPHTLKIGIKFQYLAQYK